MNDILIVDESKELLEIFSLMLKNKNLKCRTAQSLDVLFKEIQKKLPDLLLMDIRFNEADARKICADLKTRNAFKTIPIILMSANPNKLIDYKKYNADAILEKPFDMMMFLRLISQLLAKSETSELITEKKLIKLKDA
ncbi:MAG: response regulator [Bacteroidota bacterium]